MTDLSGTPTPPQPTILAGFRSLEEAETAAGYLEAEAIPRERIGSRAPEALPQTVSPSDVPAEAAPAIAPPGQEVGDRSEDAEPRRETGEDLPRVLRTGGAGIFGAMAAAGVAVASGGAAVPAMAAAVAGGLGAGGLSELASKVSLPDQTTEVDEQPACVLVVSPENPDQAERARGILRKVSTIRVWEEAPSA